MAAIPDQGNPGEDLPAQPAQDDLLNAYGAGYTHDDVTVATGTEPPRPDIGEIWGGASPADATWAPPGGDNDPTRLDTNVRPQIDQVAESGVGVGAIEGVLGRAAKLGVTTLETADTVAPAVLAQDRTIGQTFSAMAGNKWARRGAAAYLGYNAFYPNKIMQKAGY